MGEKTSFRSPDIHFATRAIHEGQSSDQWNTNAVVPPISVSTIFKKTVSSPLSECGFNYIRESNPTRKCLESSLAALENGKYGYCFASGMAAIDCVMRLMDVGDHIICSHELYVGTRTYFSNLLKKSGIGVSFVDTADSINVINEIRSNTKLVWLDTPSNPTLTISDISDVATSVRKQDIRILVAVDNTFLTPYFQQPLALGADIVVHSATKYLGGHSDALLGVIVTNREDLHSQILFLHDSIGAVPSPFDCYLVLRGIKTLHLRMREHQRNGFAVAKYLEKHPYVEKVIHPGLASHPGHKIACKQSCGHSGMIVVALKGGSKEAITFVQNLKIFTHATSLGGVESLAMHLATVPYALYTPEERYAINIQDNMVRISVGLEDEHDLIADLDQALSTSQKNVVTSG